MKKKLLGTLLAVALLVTQSIGVFAADSKTTQATPSGDSVGKYEMTEGTRENFSEVSSPEVLEQILAVNEGTAILESIAGQSEELKAELQGKTLVTKFFDLVPIDGGVKTEDGKYKVTFTVPNLTEALKDVKLLHYSTVRNVWEVITPSDVNYESKQITAEFEDLSPVAVIATKSGAGDSATSGSGTSPQTGVGSDWGIYVSAAVVLLGAAVVLGRKKRA